MLETPNGTKRSLGFVVMLLPFILPFFGYELGDAAPVEMATLADPIVAVVGGCILIWGTLKAKAPLWFVKR